jgi:hypothetical protein
MFEKLSKSELFDVMKNMVFVYSSAWFKSERIIIEKFGVESLLSRDFIELFRDFGWKEAKVLVDLSIVSGKNADSIVKALGLSHWALFENITLEKLSDNAVKMRTIDCSRQKYAVKKCGVEYPCKDLKFSYESRLGFVRAINPSADVKCIFCPPDPKPAGTPQNVSCEWIIHIP